MEHFLLRTKCCKCDERLDVGHKGKQWLWYDLIILILLDSQSPVLLFELLGCTKLLALLSESRQEGSVWTVIVAFQPFIHLIISSRLLKYQRSLGICELRGKNQGRKKEMSWVWKLVRDLFGILHMAASGISFDPLLLIKKTQEGWCTATLHIFMASGSLHLRSEACQMGRNPVCIVVFLQTISLTLVSPSARPCCLSSTWNQSCALQRTVSKCT